MRPRPTLRLAAVPLALAVTLTACSSDADDSATVDTAATTGGEASLPRDADVGEEASDEMLAVGRAPGTTAADAASGEPAPLPFDESRPTDVTFAAPGFHDFVDPLEDPLSTFALDVDTASYTLARSWITQGQRPPAASVRLEEWVNHHDFGDPAPVDGTWEITAEGGTSPLAEGRDLLRVGLHAREIADEDRPDAVLTFVVDVSGSMDRDDRLGLVKRSLGLLVDNLRPTDEVGIVTYGDTASLLLRPTPVSEAAQIHSAIDRLRAGGATFAEGGLRLGYEVASQAQVPGATNTVILLSDGVANVGETGPDRILEEIRDAVDRGIRMAAVGVGMGNFNDVLLERLANDGDGSYWYVDDERQAERVFVDGLTGTLTPIADEAKVQVEFRDDVVRTYRQLGYVNRAIADEDFRNESVDAGEVGAGHQVSALWEIELEPTAEADDVLATVVLRWTEPATGEVLEQERDVTVAELRSGGERFALARAVVAGAEVLAGSPHTGITMDDVVGLVAGLDDLGEDAAEFAAMMRTAADLR